MGCQRIPQTTTDLEPISSPSSARSARTDSRDGSCRASARSCLRHMRARWDRSTSTMPPSASASAANTLEPAGLRSRSTWRRSSRFSSSSSRMYLFHTNDMHSRVEPFPEDFQDTMLADKAGLLRRATFIKQQRKIHEDLLLFDSGDFSQGTPYYNMFKYPYRRRGRCVQDRRTPCRRGKG